MYRWTRTALFMFVCLPAALGASARAEEALPKASIDGTGPGWRDLTGEDFQAANCDPDTFKWEGNSLSCTGQPVGVIRSKKPVTNLELSLEWKHLKPAGNSGVFLWGTEESITALKRGGLPQGIEVQILDHGYADNFRKQNDGKDPDWFTTNGDVFPTQASTMIPFEPKAPNKSMRSFPRKNLSKGHGEWNHYYIRAINGEVRLWVNGEEVSGGTKCNPATGYLCLESEGSPIEFRNLKIRELP